MFYSRISSLIASIIPENQALGFDVPPHPVDGSLKYQNVE